LIALTEKIKNAAAFVLDMDGTVFLDDQLLPGAIELVAYFNRTMMPYLFLTNNSSRQRFQYAQKLNRLGLAVNEDQIFTSGEATAIFLKQQFNSIHQIYLVGTPALEQEFRQHGFELTRNNPAAVVLGFDTTLTYEKLWQICNFIRAGLPYFATHPDINCPTLDGVMPDIGAMIAFIKASTGREPDHIIGKPNPPVVSALTTRLKLPAEKICMVGDRLYTDIALGQAGLATVLVLSGETNAEMAVESRFKPDLMVQNLAGLLQFLMTD
jgi:HAD superfamily hydrolase (TIGR01450 family)